ncbi:hypothetical protein QDT91_28330 (plasmid) [Mycolicibacterium aubagnense]|uniref:hypothetical protein n=1 Tax=Mycolicibacterium aubagnense TaxID=319707 RepID=UPI0010FF2B68|nr:hypothetical protein [Mycolicibacterium aubagnense]MBN9634231.1 hypothetical protein [Actinomycetota bacterium]WGI35922.1 hypothetical protein QDT91_28330 [Mycolicibacterium aubagnense]
MARTLRSRAVGRVRAWISVIAAVALVPWILYLGGTLPQDYAAAHWRATWIGFDVLLVLFLFATAVLGFLRSPLLTVVAFTTGVLLLCDAWFDVMTAQHGDQLTSVISAVCGELPLAVLLIGGTLRIVRLNEPPFSRRMLLRELVTGQPHDHR